jgi:hypothetical protein
VKRRCATVVLLIGFVLVVDIAEAQQTKKHTRVGFLLSAQRINPISTHFAKGCGIWATLKAKTSLLSTAMRKESLTRFRCLQQKSWL